MARSWRNFFRRSKNKEETPSEEQGPQTEAEASEKAPATGDSGVAVAEQETTPDPEAYPEPEAAEVEEPPVEEVLEAEEEPEEDVKLEEELEEEIKLEEREELEAALTEDVEVEEPPAAVARPEEVDEEAPESISEGYAPEDPEATEDGAEAQTGGWFGRLRKGLRRSRESMVGQFNAAVAEFRDVEDEEFWERVEEILISSDVGVPTTAKLVRELEQEALERNITSGPPPPPPPGTPGTAGRADG